MFMSRTLNVGTRLPLDEFVGVMNQRKSLQFDGGVSFKGGFPVTKGKGLLDAQMVNVEGIVARVVRRTAGEQVEKNDQTVSLDTSNSSTHVSIPMLVISCNPHSPKAIVGQAVELSGNHSTRLVVVEFHVGKSHVGDILKGNFGRFGPLLSSRRNVGTRRMILQRIGSSLLLL